MTYDEWKEILQENNVRVMFLKTDGSLREMRCTLQSDQLPQMITEEGSEVQKKRVQNENAISVWDLDNNGWRSFRIENVCDWKLES